MKRICSSRGLYETRFRYASSAQLLSKRNYGIRFLVYFCRRGTENSRQVAENSKAVRIARTRYFRSYDLSSFAERAQLGEKHRWSYSTETLTLTRVTLRWIITSSVEAAKNGKTVSSRKSISRTSQRTMRGAIPEILSAVQSEEMFE